MKLTWFGTACFALESGEDRILFDPFLELMGGTNGVDPQILMEYDTIFVTHGHFDHLYNAVDLIEGGDGGNTLFCTKHCCELIEGFLDDQSNVVQIDMNRSYKIGSIDIDVLKGAHIEFQKSHIFDTLTPLRVLRYAGNLPFLFWANRTFTEGGECVPFLVRAEGKQVLILGSLAIDPQTDYPQGVDVLVLPYQGNNDLPLRAGEVLERLRPRSVVLSHFDNAFPPMSRDVDLRPLSKLMQERFADIKVVKPVFMKPVSI